MSEEVVYKHETEKILHQAIEALGIRQKEIEEELKYLQPQVVKLENEQALVRASLKALSDI